MKISSFKLPGPSYQFQKDLLHRCYRYRCCSGACFAYHHFKYYKSKRFRKTQGDQHNEICWCDKQLYQDTFLYRGYGSWSYCCCAVHCLLQSSLTRAFTIYLPTNTSCSDSSALTTSIHLIRCSWL